MQDHYCCYCDYLVVVNPSCHLGFTDINLQKKMLSKELHQVNFSLYGLLLRRKLLRMHVLLFIVVVDILNSFCESTVIINLLKVLDCAAVR